jgi:hypothetical protein
MSMLGLNWKYLVHIFRIRLEVGDVMKSTIAKKNVVLVS